MSNVNFDDNSPSYSDMSISSSPSDGEYYKENKKSLVQVKKSHIWSGSYTEKNEHVPKKTKSHVEPRMSFKDYVEDNDFEDETLPERIEGTYFYDYNILKIDEILMKKFEQDKKNNLISLKQKLEIENVKILGKQNMIERKTSRKKIAEIEEEMRKYEQDENKNKYSRKSKYLMEEYKKIGPISTIISFTSNLKESEIISPENEEQQTYRHKIISEYLEIARKYISIDLLRKIPNSNSCPLCGISYDEIELIEDESGTTTCPNCGLEKIHIVKTQFYSDNSRVNNSKNNYEDRANFYKVLLRRQGKQVNKPAKELYDKLDEYFISRGLPTSKGYNEMPLLPDGTKENSSKELMYEALANMGCSGYYDDIDLICSVFFGWYLENLTHLEDSIMKDYDDFQQTFRDLPDREGRKSSLNSQWLLYILLKRRGINCKSKDFKIPSTPSILEYHKMKTKETYEKLKWECFF